MRSGMFVSVDPASGEVISRHEDHDEGELERRLGEGFDTFTQWRTAAMAERGQLLAAVSGLLEERRAELAELMVREMGKPVGQAEAEIDKCAWVCRHYAETAQDALAPERVATDDGVDSWVRFDPLGPVLAIMPWNYPLWQVFRAAAPALMAGNTVLLKHAPNVTGSALAIEELFAHAGAPAGLVQVLLIDEDRTDELLGDPRVRAVTLTGSVQAGRVVAAAAGRALKKHVLELGGSDAFLVLADADLDRAAEVAAQSRLLNNGQSCIAAKRFVAVDEVYDEFVERFVGHVAAAVVGDPMDRQVTVGPLARQDLRNQLAGQVGRAVEQGATVLCGEGVPDRDGWFHDPMVLEDPDGASAVWREETFGPVAVVRQARSAHDAVAMANDSPFGLGASVWTEDRNHVASLATQLEAGCVMVNQLVKSDPRVPFGGVKDSGYGRELGDYGIREFVNTKTLWIE